MKLKYNFEMMEMEDNIIAIPLGEGSRAIHGIIKLNESAAAIFSLLKNEITEEEIINSLKSEYDNKGIEIEEFVHGYIQQLSDQGILE